MATTAAERKARQRQREREAVTVQPPEQWGERHCLAVLADAGMRADAGRAAWERLGDIHGWRDSHTHAARDSHAAKMPDTAREAAAELTRRVEQGEQMHKVLRSIAMRATNADVRWGTLAVPADLVPGPGEVAVAMRGGTRSDGYTKKLMDRAGLQRRDDIGAWCGVTSPATAAKLVERTKTTTATVVLREGTPA